MYRAICIWHWKHIGDVNKLVPTNTVAGNQNLMYVVYTDMRRFNDGDTFWEMRR
jgi:hypothetical protein